MKIKIYFLFFTIVFFIVFFIFYKGLQNPNNYKPTIKIKKNIPSFKAKMFDSGISIDSEEIFKGNQFYLMNIWASWCVPCRKEHTFLVNLSKKKNIKIIGLNYKDNSKHAKDFLKELGNPYKFIFLDKDGIIAIEWGAFGVPETFLIHNNKIIKKIIGPINKDSLLEIERLIK